jgi:hypothetical protein
LPNHNRVSDVVFSHKSRKTMKSTAATLSLKTPLAIPAYWTPEQARAVIELLDELRDLIWANYGLQLIDEYSPHDNLSDPQF